MPRKVKLFAALIAVVMPCVRAQQPDPAAEVKAHYLKAEYHVKMRDGITLFTIVYTPREATQDYPFLVMRTPYGIAPYGPDAYRPRLGPSPEFDRAGYIFVFQDVRGRYQSEGAYVKPTPHIDHPTGVQHDESTDMYDTVEWLLKNVPHNNGRVGIYGVSQAGYVCSASIIDGHPAIKAASPQAPVTDYHNNDDYYHNGALMLETTNFYGFFRPQPQPVLPSRGTPLPQVYADAYTEFLHEWEPLPKAKALVVNPYFNEVVDHPDYDPFWQSRDISRHLHNIHAAVLVVGGWFDAEDPTGPIKTFHAIAEQSPQAREYLVMGPWVHGGWNYDGARLGDVTFGSKTGETFRQTVQFPFFEHYLKDAADPSLPAATVFETGSNVWRSYTAWPPPGAKPRLLYLQPGGKLGFDPPAADATPYDQYRSDPAHPVPEFADAHAIGPPQVYMDADQRFAATRSDVLVYQTEPLTEDMTFAGPLQAKLHVSTSGTDSDFVVKLIDVSPQDLNVPAPATPAARPPDVVAPRALLPGYQQLVRGEPARGKYRKSLSHPVPFKPNRPDEVDVSLLNINHTFLKGHRIMVQIQSSWFPLVDLNPQVFVDIPSARPEDFKPATERIFHTPRQPSAIEFTTLP